MTGRTRTRKQRRRLAPTDAPPFRRNERCVPAVPHYSCEVDCEADCEADCEPDADEDGDACDGDCDCE